MSRPGFEPGPPAWEASTLEKSHLGSLSAGYSEPLLSRHLLTTFGPLHCGVSFLEIHKSEPHIYIYWILTGTSMRSSILIFIILFQHKKRVARLVTIVTIVFTISWLPIHVIMLLKGKCFFLIKFGRFINDL
jgi:hypothetical protein